MSKKRMMPKSVRIYYEQCKKKKLEQELAEYYKNLRVKELEYSKSYSGRDY
jgi:hypothetical protein